MSHTHANVYQLLKHRYGVEAAKTSQKVHESLLQAPSTPADVSVFPLVTPLSESKARTSIIAELTLLRDSANTFSGTHDTAAALSWERIKRSTPEYNAAPEHEVVEWATQVMSSTDAFYHSEWLRKTIRSLNVKLNENAVSEWLPALNVGNFVTFNSGHNAYFVKTQSLLNEYTIRTLEGFTGVPLIGYTPTDAGVSLSVRSPHMVALAAELTTVLDDHSGLRWAGQGECITITPYTTDSTQDASVLVAEFHKYLDHPLDNAHLLVSLIEENITPTSKIATKISIEQLPELYQLRSIHENPIEDVAAVVSISPNASYHFSVGDDHSEATTLAKIRSDQDSRGRIERGEPLYVKPAKFSEISVQIPIAYVKNTSSDPIELPVQRNGAVFSVSAPFMSEADIRLRWPYARFMNAQFEWAEYKKMQNHANRYIRDPLTPTEMQESMNSITSDPRFVRDAKEAMIAWMLANDTKCHASFDALYDPVSGMPFFVSMNLYRVLKSGSDLDYRNVAVVIKSIAGEPFQLTPQALLMSGLRPEDHESLGIDSSAADQLLTSALNRATSNSNFKFTSQWVNGLHSDRRLNHVMPLLMNYLSRTPCLDSIALVKSQSLSQWPTYTVAIPAFGDYAYFEDAEVPCHPMLLGKFLMNDAATTLRCVDGLYEITKDSGQLFIRNTVNDREEALAMNASELRSFSLQKSTTLRNEQNPAKTLDILDRTRIRELTYDTLNAQSDIPWNESRFVWPSDAYRIVPQDHLIAINNLFSEFQKHCDYGAPLHVLTEQFELMLKTDLPQLHNSLEGDVFVKTEQETNRDVLKKIAADPLLFNLQQTKVSERSLQSLLDYDGGSVESPWVSVGLTDVIRWNLARSLSINEPKMAVLQSQRTLMTIAQTIEPSRSREATALFKSVEERTGIPYNEVSKVYLAMYNQAKSDPNTTAYLPGRRNVTPLMRNLLLRDMSVWNALYHRNCNPHINPDMTPLIQGLHKAATSMKILQWVGHNVRPYVQNGRFSTIRSMDGQYHHQLPTLNKADKLLSFADPVPLAHAEHWDQLFSQFSVLNSVGHLFTKLQNDRTIDMRELVSLRKDMVNYFQSDEFKKLISSASDYIHTNHPNGVRLTEQSKISAHVTKILRAAGEQTKWPRLPWLTESDTRTLQEKTELALGRPSTNAESRYWNTGVRRAGLAELILSSAPRGLILTDSQPFLSSDWAGLLQDMGIEPVEMTLREFAATISLDRVKSILGVHERQQWIAYIQGDGILPNLRSIVHQAVRHAEGELLNPQRLFDFPENVRTLMAQFTYKTNDPIGQWVNIMPDKPINPIPEQPSVQVDNTHAHELPDFSRRK